MADLLQPQKNNQENIHAFIDSIEDVDLQQLIRDKLPNILNSDNSNNRTDFFEALQSIIERQIQAAES